MGISGIHANSDDFPWKTPQKSIIIRTNSRNTRIMMDFSHKEHRQNSHEFPKFPYTVHPVQQSPIYRVTQDTPWRVIPRKSPLFPCIPRDPLRLKKYEDLPSALKISSANETFNREWTFLRKFPVTPTPSTFSEVLPYKWEAYCWASLSSRLRNQEGTAIQMGDVLPYKLEGYYSTFSYASRAWGFLTLFWFSNEPHSKALFFMGNSMSRLKIKPEWSCQTRMKG